MPSPFIPIRMKLVLQPISQWHHNEKYNIALSAPMSPMLAAKDFVSKVFDKEQMVITGLFRIRSEGEPTFTTWEHADVDPVQVDVICCVLNFRHFAVFGEIGSRYMPIALVLDGDAQFSELYTSYNWVSAPTVQEIADVLSTINLPELKSSFDSYRWSVKGEQANDWYLEQTMQEHLKIMNAKTPLEADTKWDKLTPKGKYEYYKVWTGTK